LVKYERWGYEMNEQQFSVDRVIQEYKNIIANLISENVLLKLQLEQAQKPKEDNNE
jgi:hypothetical protein